MPTIFNKPVYDSMLKMHVAMNNGHFSGNLQCNMYVLESNVESQASWSGISPMKGEGASGGAAEALAHNVVAAPGSPLVVTEGKNSLRTILKQYSTAEEMSRVSCKPLRTKKINHFIPGFWLLVVNDR